MPGHRIIQGYQNLARRLLRSISGNPDSATYEKASRGKHWLRTKFGGISMLQSTSARQIASFGDRCRALAERTSDQRVYSALREMAADFESIAATYSGPKLSS